MLNGKLTDMGKELQNILVVIREPEVGVVGWLGLQDETGVLLKAPEEPPMDHALGVAMVNGSAGIRAESSITPVTRESLEAAEHD